jgi:type IV pilus assembly protein PilV
MFQSTKTQAIRRQNNEGGFTMIEILMALIILTLGIMAYGASSGSIMTRNTHSTQQSIATTLAQDKIEELKGQALGGLLVGVSTVTINETVNEKGDTTGNHLVYQRATTVSDAGHACGCYYDISVNVAWNNNGDHSVTLNTQVSQ